MLPRMVPKDWATGGSCGLCPQNPRRARRTKHTWLCRKPTCCSGEGADLWRGEWADPLRGRDVGHKEPWEPGLGSGDREPLLCVYEAPAPGSRPGGPLLLPFNKYSLWVCCSLGSALLHLGRTPF